MSEPVASLYRGSHLTIVERCVSVVLRDVLSTSGRGHLDLEPRSTPIFRGTNPAPDYLADLRSLAKALSALSLDSPARSVLLKSIGLNAHALSPRCCLSLSRDLLREVERHEASERFAIPWDKLPDPSRESCPRSAGLNTRRLSEVSERAVDWLWPQRIPVGKLSLISGDPDLGKTWTVLDVIARVTTGRPFPDAPNPFGSRRNALWVSAEDEDEDTILPRLRKLNGDPSRVHNLSFVFDEGKERTLSLGEHLGYLDRWLQNNPLVAIMAIDPLSAFLGRVDSHRNSDVRALLTPLRTLASKRQVAIVGINHLSKGDGDNALYRGMGSIAFVAAARSSYLVTRDASGPPDRRLFLKVKNNNEEKPVGGLAYRIGPHHTAAFFWEDIDVKKTAAEALRPYASNENTRAPARSEAKEWLQDLLKSGPVLAADAWAKAEADKMCPKTIKSAIKELGVVSKKTGGTGAPWSWSLPNK